jgi:hypothetical protein
MKTSHALLGIDEATWAPVLAGTGKSLQQLLAEIFEEFTQPLIQRLQQPLPDPPRQAWERAWERDVVARGVKPWWLDEAVWAQVQARVAARQAGNDDVS